MLSGAHALLPLWWNQSNPLLETSAATGGGGGRARSFLHGMNNSRRRDSVYLPLYVLFISQTIRQHTFT